MSRKFLSSFSGSARLVTIIGLVMVLVSKIQGKKVPIFVTEVFRHGARTSTKNKITPVDVKYEGEENLIADGMRSHYVLGTAVRELYKDSIFGTPHTWNSTRVFTSEYERTFISALSHMAGIHPLGTGPNISLSDPNDPLLLPPMPTTSNNTTSHFSIEDGFSPIYIEIVPVKNDVFFGRSVYKVCPKMALDKKIKYPQLIKDIQLTLDPTAVEVSKLFDPKVYFGTNTYNLESLSKIADINKATLFAHDKQLEGLSWYLATQLVQIRGIQQIYSKFPNEYQRKMWTHNMGTTLISRLQSKIDGDQEWESLRYLAYSGHESNVIPLMIALGLTTADCQIQNLKRLQNMTINESEKLEARFQFDTKYPLDNITQITDGMCMTNPPFASNIIFELSKDDQTEEYYGRVYYNGKLVQTKQVCSSYEKDGTCAFKDFKQSLTKILTLVNTTFVESCGADPADLKNDNQISDGIIRVNKAIYAFQTSFGIEDAFIAVSCIVFIIELITLPLLLCFCYLKGYFSKRGSRGSRSGARYVNFDEQSSSSGMDSNLVKATFK